MVSKFTQSDRLGVLHTVLGEDEIVLHGLDAREAMNKPFDFTVRALRDGERLDPDQLIGTHATIEIETLDQGPRFFDGIIVQSKWTGVVETAYSYEFTLRPWFWLADQRRNNKIFHEKSVVDILEEVFGDYSGYGDEIFENRLTGSYDALEYTVQYRETDMAFCCRLMERFGINFHFEHILGNHCLVLTDQVDSLKTAPGGGRDFRAIGHEHRYEKEQIWKWHPGRQLTTGKIAQTDYNFKTPMVSMKTEQTGDAAHAHGQIESYDYPGVYLETGFGQEVATLRTDQERSGDVRHYAKGNTLSVIPGMRMTLEGDAVPELLGKEYVLRESLVTFKGQGYVGGSETSDDHAYTVDMTFVEADGPVVPQRKTPMPVHYGPQTATVVGDGEIDCDEFGRIIVLFHWDRLSANSMRCRVSQGWASGGWGNMTIPRIGMEVLVEFLEGDPDKPMVTGAVYNGKNDPPYELPANKTKMVIRSDTHQGSGYNEISFEDEAGQEDIFMHAQKDHTVKVLHDQSTNIGSNRIEAIGNNASIQVGRNVMERVGANKSTTIGGSGAGMLKMLQPLIAAGGKFMDSGAKKVDAGSLVIKFAGVLSGVSDLANELSAIQSKSGFASSGGHVTEAGAQQSAKSSAMGGLLSMIMPATGTNSVVVEKHQKTTVGLSSSEQVGIAKNVLVGGVLTTSVGKLMKTSVGEDIDIEAKKSIFARTDKHTLHAKTKFVIGGPGGTIIIDSSGVTIKAKHLKVKAPKVDFTSGAPDQVDALNSDKPFAQDCKGK
ncbi:type VI secretion system tip protein VgrG [Alphaproteobacteria bacterium KMM 3653]|uniref:Type VI secretion system tip protein VgrG n=1 Tax=Harenicola maris TaxID=2841044 RepID=A0AAP2G416_9RHOB|nr:type VI secretion system tip protein VgrG [Harenicola maris]